jgi:hypothetical protein
MLDSDANGNCAIAVRPELGYTYNLCGQGGAGGVAGTVVTTNATWNLLTTVLPATDTYRITSFGVRAYSNQKELDDRGYGFVCTRNAAFLVSTGYDVSNAVIFTEKLTASLKHGNIFEWVASPTGTLSRAFVYNNSSGDTQGTLTQNTFWTECMMLFQGLNASTVGAVRVEIYANIEYIPTLASGLAVYARTTPIDNPALKNAASIVAKKLDSAIVTKSQELSGQLRESAAHWAGEVAANAVSAFTGGVISSQNVKDFAAWATGASGRGGPQAPQRMQYRDAPRGMITFMD